MDKTQSRDVEPVIVWLSALIGTGVTILAAGLLGLGAFSLVLASVTFLVALGLNYQYTAFDEVGTLMLLFLGVGGLSMLVFEASFIYLFCICPIAGGLIVSLTLSLGSTRLLEVGDQS